MEWNKLFRRESEQGAGSVPSAGGSQGAAASGGNTDGGNYKAQPVGIYTADQAMRVSAWYCAQERLANTMAQLTIEYQKKNDYDHGGNYERDMRGQGRHLNYLLSMQPNPDMTAAEMLKQMTIARFNQGNAVVYIERGMDMEVLHLWLCTTAQYNTGSNNYFISYYRHGKLVSRTVEPQDVLHWRNTYSRDGGMTGVSTLDFAGYAVSLAATNDRQAAEIAAKGGKLKLILSEDTKKQAGGISRQLNKAQKEGQRDKLQEALDKGSDVLLMSGLMAVTPISQSAENQQLLETRKFDVQSIARFTGVPPQLLMDYSNNNYKAPEQAMQDFLMRTIQPMLFSLVAELNAKLIGEYGYPDHRFYGSIDQLMMLDPTAKANVSKSLLETGILCPNELRAQYDLPLIQDGDRHFVSANLKPLNGEPTQE